MPLHFDYMVVGAGFAGLVMAERLANGLGKKVLVVEKRGHIGGNSQDEYDSAGVLIHKYGPHYFRTNSQAIVRYLSQFTDWHPVDYTIKSFSNGRYWSFPVNLNTFEEFIGRKSSREEFERWLEQNRIKIDCPSNSEEIITSRVGMEFYKLFFEGYTLKQWEKHPRELDPSVCGRIPVRTNRDDRYLTEKFQALPKKGYHKLFENLVRSTHGKIELILNTDYRTLLPEVRFGHMVYTGPIDAYFEYAYGDLPYRSLCFEPESFSSEELLKRYPISKKNGFWQPAVQVNYPNEERFTRIVEMKHATGQKTGHTTIVREYPRKYNRRREPYYPVPTNESEHLYKKYRERADKEKNVTFLGRLATYRYYNMDQVIGLSLKAFEKIRAKQEM